MTRKFGCLLMFLLGNVRRFHAASVGAICGIRQRQFRSAPDGGGGGGFLSPPPKWVPPVFTDSRGYYLANDLPAGTYYVKVTAASFSTVAGGTTFFFRSGAHGRDQTLPLIPLRMRLRLMPTRRY